MPFEQLVRAVGQLQQPDPFLNVGLVGGLVRRDVVPALGKGMLCLADRFFPSCDLWQRASQTGADLLWRVRQNARLDVDQRLADGSYLSRIYASTSDRRHQRKGIVVRVVDVLFRAPFGEHLVFKGGSSLSMGYAIINRFSEDIDLTYDIRALARP